MAFTTSELLASIRRRCLVPNVQQLYDDASTLLIANDEMRSFIIPKIMNVNEEYFVDYEDITIVANQNSYAIPSDAVGSKLREVVLADANGNLTNLPRVDLETVSGFSNNTMNFGGFRLQGNNVILYPTPTTASPYTLRLYYVARRNALVPVTDGGQVTSVNTLTNEITLSRIPSSWAVNTKLCIINDEPQFDTIVKSTTISNISSPTVTVDDVTGVAIGNWVQLKGYSIVPQIPVEMHDVLAQATCVKILEALGHTDKMKMAQAKLDEIIFTTLEVLTPRVEGELKTIVSNGQGLWDMF